MKFIIVTGYIFLSAWGCQKRICYDHHYPALKASRISGPTDSLRFNLVYGSNYCDDFGGFQEYDSAGIHIVYLKCLRKDCNCTDTVSNYQRPYAIKMPAPGTYYFKWGPFPPQGGIDTVIVP